MKAKREPHLVTRHHDRRGTDHVALLGGLIVASAHDIGSFVPADSARGVAVSGSYAYVADYDDGLRVIDLSP